MTVLCGTDFSALSDRACRVAAALAKKTGEPLVLLHAVAAAASDDPAFAKERKTAKASLQTLAEELRQSGIDAQERVETGSADSVITAIAEEVRAGLIVVGAAGHRGWRWSLGSTADRTISAASIPVLVVREGLPAEEWIAGARPLRVAVATDLSPISDRSVEWASRLGRYGRCEFVVVHVSWPPEAYDRLGIEGPMSLDQTHPLVEELIRREIGDTVKQLETVGAVEVLIESSFGKPADSLSSAASQARADLLVVGHRSGRTWRIWEGSVARQVIRLAPVTVACVPDVASGVAVAAPDIRCIVAATDLSPQGNAAVA